MVYLMQNPVYIYISNIYEPVGFNVISTLVDDLMPNSVYIYTDTYDLVWFGSMAY